MKSFTFLIQTTQNIVGFKNITVKDINVSPIVGVYNSLTPLPIIADYYNFIKSPSGVIQKYTKISSYRLDLTSSIDSGESWQLGFLVAHLINHFGTLSFSKTDQLIPNEEESILWCSGVINANLDLSDVNHIKTKLLNSKKMFDDALKQKKIIYLCVSEGNAKDVEDFLRKYDHSLKKNLKLVSIKNAKELFEIINYQKVFFQNNTSLKKKSLKIFSVILIVIIIIPLLLFFFKTANAFFNLKTLRDNNKHISLMRDLADYRQSDFSLKFSVFLFDYFQSRNHLSMNETIKIKLKAELLFDKLKEKNKFVKLSKNLDCLNILNIQNYKIINKMCKTYVDVLNVGVDNKFVWIIKLTDKYKSTKKPSVMTTYLNKNDLITISFNSQKDTSLIFIFGNSFNKNINKWIYNLIRGKAILSKTLYRINALGFSYKKLEFRDVILIND